MTTLVWDNQQDYSNHQIWFIELAPDENVEEAIQVLETYPWLGDAPKVIAVVNNVTWRAPNTTATMSDWLEEAAVALTGFYDLDYPKQAPKLKMWPLAWRKRLVVALKKTDTEYSSSWADDIQTYYRERQRYIQNIVTDLVEGTL